MKPSRYSLVCHIAGIALFIFATIMRLAFDAEDVVIPIGMSGLGMMWILGIERDLYGKKNQRQIEEVRE